MGTLPDLTVPVVNGLLSGAGVMGVLGLQDPVTVLMVVPRLLVGAA